MKKKISFIAGFMAGAVLFGAVGVFAADVVAKLSAKKCRSVKVYFQKSLFLRKIYNLFIINRFDKII